MKMLFYSADANEVATAETEFVNAGIPCEVRKNPGIKGIKTAPPCAELWIRDDHDCHRAFMLCVQLGIGFSRRHHQANPLDLEPEEEQHDEMETADIRQAAWGN